MTTTLVDPFTGEVADQLVLFEGKQIDAARHTITGSFAAGEDGPNPLPDFKLDQLVTLRVTGTVSKVTMARMKDGSLERQHVIVLTDARVIPDPSDILREGSGVLDKDGLHGLNDALHEHAKDMLPEGIDSMTLSTSDGRSTTVTRD